jgi:hypothetical protein
MEEAVQQCGDRDLPSADNPKSVPRYVSQALYVLGAAFCLLSKLLSKISQSPTSNVGFVASNVDDRQR